MALDKYAKEMQKFLVNRMNKDKKKPKVKNKNRFKTQLAVRG